MPSALADNKFLVSSSIDCTLCFWKWTEEADGAPVFVSANMWFVHSACSPGVLLGHIARHTGFLSCFLILSVGPFRLAFFALTILDVLFVVFYILPRVPYQLLYPFLPMLICITVRMLLLGAHRFVGDISIGSRSFQADTRSELRNKRKCPCRGECKCLVTCADSSPGGMFYATGSTNAYLTVYQVGPAKQVLCVARDDSHDGLIESVKFSHAGDAILT